jgi:predicted RNA-binding Zn ribbon-like protein
MFVSGNLALDLAGTLKWRRDTPEELLATPGDLDRWLVDAGLLDTPPGADDHDLRTARRLREAAYTLVTARTGHRALPADALAVANDRAAVPPTRVALTPGGLRRSGPVGAALSDVARALLTLLADPDAPVKECAKPACTRLYLDRSRGARRTWCGMQECGSQAKMAAYRARRRA